MIIDCCMYSRSAEAMSLGKKYLFFSDLPVGIFSVVNGQDVYNEIFLIDDIEKSELANSVPPGIRDVPLELLDIVAPKRLCLYLWVHKSV